MKLEIVNGWYSSSPERTMQHDRTGQEQKKSLPSSRALMNAVPRAVASGSQLSQLGQFRMPGSHEPRLCYDQRILLPVKHFRQHPPPGFHDTTC